jgi:hypothetical protein
MKTETATTKEATMRRFQLTGEPAEMLADDKAVSARLAPLQPRWRERDERVKRIHLGGWFRNQGERSRLMIRGGHTIGRIDCVKGGA